MRALLLGIFSIMAIATPAQANSPLVGWRMGLEVGYNFQKRSLDISQQRNNALERLNQGIASGEALISEGEASLFASQIRVDQAINALNALLGLPAFLVPADQVNSLRTQIVAGQNNIISAQSALDRGRSDLNAATALRSQVISLPNHINADSSGIQMRMSLGYSERVWSNLVMGFDADLGWQDSYWTGRLPPLSLRGNPTNISMKTDFSFGANLRMGWLINSQWMPWVSIGGEAAQVHTRYTGGSNRTDMIPGLRVGGGVDWAPHVDNNLFFRLGYEYISYLNTRYQGIGRQMESHSIRVGFFRNLMM